MALQDLVGRLLNVRLPLSHSSLKQSAPHEGVLDAVGDDPLRVDGLDNHSRITGSLHLEKKLAKWLKY